MEIGEAIRTIAPCDIGEAIRIGATAQAIGEAIRIGAWLGPGWDADCASAPTVAEARRCGSDGRPWPRAAAMRCRGFGGRGE